MPKWSRARLCGASASPKQRAAQSERARDHRSHRTAPQNPWAQHVADYGKDRDDKAAQQKSLYQLHIRYYPTESGFDAYCRRLKTASSGSMCRRTPIGAERGVWQHLEHGYSFKTCCGACRPYSSEAL